MKCPEVLCFNRIVKEKTCSEVRLAFLDCDDPTTNNLNSWKMTSFNITDPGPFLMQIQWRNYEYALPTDGPKKR
jgi:hypothetical protein